MVKSSFAPLLISNNPLHVELLKCMEKYSDKTALVDGITDEHVTYEKLRSNVERLAYRFQQIGIKRRDIVSIFAPNSLKYIYSIFGVMMNGAASALVNPVLTPYELQNAIELLDSKIWVTTSQLYPKLVKTFNRTNTNLLDIKVIILDWNRLSSQLPPNTFSFSKLIDQNTSLNFEEENKIKGNRNHIIPLSKHQKTNMTHNLTYKPTYKTNLTHNPTRITTHKKSNSQGKQNSNYLQKEIDSQKLSEEEDQDNPGKTVEFQENSLYSNEQNIAGNSYKKTNNVSSQCDIDLVNGSLDVKNDPVFIIFSSGTTGLPKGVMLTHHNIVFMLSVLNHFFGPANSTDESEEQPVTLLVLPIFHVFGLVGVLLNFLMSGHEIVVLPRFLPELSMKCVDKYKVRMFPMVPTIIVFLMNSSLCTKYQLTSIKQIICGAAPLSKQTELDFIRTFKLNEISQGYGMTEITLAATMNSKGMKGKYGSVGHVVPNTEIIVTCLKTGKELGPNEKGEILIRGPGVMLGYLYNKCATEETINDEGFIKTGDIGYYDEDGYFFIVDRIKELIKYKAFQVSPAELEMLILNHSQVDDVAVIGIPNEEAGEVPKAFVVKKADCSLTEEDIITHVAKNMSNFKQLRGGVEFVESIPKNESGKILRRLIRQKYLKDKEEKDNEESTNKNMDKTTVIKEENNKIMSKL